MPITPRFHLSQTETHITIDIHVPHVRVNAQSVEIWIESEQGTVHFSSPPYLLLLTFPDQSFAATEEGETAKYDPMREGGMVTMELEKEFPNTYWPNLDLVGQFTVGQRPTPASPSPSTGPTRVLLSGLDDDNDSRPRYGFANMFVQFFTDLVRDGMASEMLQLSTPDATPEEQRRILRWTFEQESFHPDRYLEDVDVTEDYIYQCAMELVPFYRKEEGNDDDDIVMQKLTQEFKNLATIPKETETRIIHYDYFTDAESMQLASIAYPMLPDSTITTSHQTKQQLLLGLLDILYAFVYDHLVTQGDPTVESSWNISTLSSTLSWLDTFHDMNDIVSASLRRTLIFPYLRNYDFALYCWNQIYMLVSQGRRSVIRALLKVRAILEQSEFHYLGNKLYIDPYLSWLQKQHEQGGVSDEDLQQLVQQLQVALDQVTKSSLGLNLTELEDEFRGYQEENLNDEASEPDDDEDDDDIDYDDEDKPDPPRDGPRRPLIEEIT